MSTSVATPAIPRLPARLLGFARDLIVGTLLCLSPLTAIIALGWLARRMRARIRRSWYGEAVDTGWFLGPKDRGRFSRLFGGVAANIRAGLLAAVGLFALTLPFTLTWLGAWWAGWENSFNKGYEQAAVGPSVWFLATLLSLPILAHLPLALAHAAAEDRFSAFWEWRRIRSVAASAGWRLVWLALFSAILSVPFFGLRAIPAFIEDIVPGFADMTITAQAEVAQGFEFATAGLAFVCALIVRRQAAMLYAISTPRAAVGRFAHLWDNHPVRNVATSGFTPGRITATVWLIVAALIWGSVPVLIVAGQFMNYDPVLWLNHPVVLLPWHG